MKTEIKFEGIDCIPLDHAMKILNISKFKMYGLFNEGRLTKMKLGKKTFVRVTEINNLFQEA